MTMVLGLHVFSFMRPICVPFLIYSLFLPILVPAAGKNGAVPSLLYHSGPKAALLKNVQQGKIASADWQQFIAGDETTWGLPRWRRGLYGATSSMATMEFADQLSLLGNKIWLVQFEIKPECRESKYVMDHTFAQDPKFISWLEANFRDLGFKSYAELKRKCFRASSSARCENLLFSHDGDNMLTAKESKCTSALNAFLDASNIKVVKDHRVADSWYVRDPNCVGKIIGTPSELLDMLSESKFWRQESGERGLPSLLLLVAEVLGEVPGLSLTQSQALTNAIKKGFPKDPSGFEETYQIPYYQTILHLVESYMQCQRGGLRRRFSNAVDAFKIHMATESGLTP